MGNAVAYFAGMMDKSLFSIGLLYNKKRVLESTVFIMVMLVIEWIGRKNQFGLEKLGLKWKRSPRYVLYFGISILIIAYAFPEEATEFIYFQF